MNSNLVQNLVVQYKNTDEKRLKNKILKEILAQFEAILTKALSIHSHQYDDKEDFRGIFNLQLYSALIKYDPNNKKNCSFSSYSYYYLAATPRLYWESIGKDVPSGFMLDEIVDCDSDPDWLFRELNGIDKQLEAEERLVFQRLCNSREKISSTKVKVQLENKIRSRYYQHKH